MRSVTGSWATASCDQANKQSRKDSDRSDKPESNYLGWSCPTTSSKEKSSRYKVETEEQLGRLQQRDEELLMGKGESPVPGLGNQRSDDWKEWSPWEYMPNSWARGVSLALNFAGKETSRSKAGREGSTGNTKCSLESWKETDQSGVGVTILQKPRGRFKFSLADFFVSRFACEARVWLKGKQEAMVRVSRKALCTQISKLTACWGMG